jgi:hypothetical protein
MADSIDRALVWFRRDLRAEDHAALYHALKDALAVWCVFVFDTDILEALPSRADRRVEFIRHAVMELQEALESLGGGLTVLHGRARELVPQLAAGDRARRGRRASAGRDRASLADIQGPIHPREGRGAYPGGQAVHGVHAVQEYVANEGRRFPGEVVSDRRPSLTPRTERGVPGADLG